MYYCQDVTETISAAATLPKPVYLFRRHHPLSILGLHPSVGSEGLPWNSVDNCGVVSAESKRVPASLDGLVDESKKVESAIFGATGRRI